MPDPHTDDPALNLEQAERLELERAWTQQPAEEDPLAMPCTTATVHRCDTAHRELLHQPTLEPHLPRKAR